jgi:hypothetical protein
MGILIDRPIVGPPQTSVQLPAAICLGKAATISASAPRRTHFLAKAAHVLSKGFSITRFQSRQFAEDSAEFRYWQISRSRGNNARHYVTAELNLKLLTVIADSINQIRERPGGISRVDNLFLHALEQQPSNQMLSEMHLRHQILRLHS